MTLYSFGFAAFLFTALPAMKRTKAGLLTRPFRNSRTSWALVPVKSGSGLPWRMAGARHCDADGHIRTDVVERVFEWTRCLLGEPEIQLLFRNFASHLQPCRAIAETVERCQAVLNDVKVSGIELVR